MFMPAWNGPQVGPDDGETEGVGAGGEGVGVGGEVEITGSGGSGVGSGDTTMARQAGISDGPQ